MAAKKKVAKKKVAKKSAKKAVKKTVKKAAKKKTASTRPPRKGGFCIKVPLPLQERFSFG